LVQYATPADLLARPADAFVSSFLGADRGLRLLSLRSADDVPTRPAPTAVTGEPTADLQSGVSGDEWVLLVDVEWRPLGGLQPSALAGETVPAGTAAPVDPVGRGATLRTLVDRLAGM
jgi:osmoprotectant transport system ATP-binding protein